MNYPMQMPLATVLFNSLDSPIFSILSTVMVKLQSEFQQSKGIAKDTDFVSPAGIATIALEKSWTPAVKQNPFHLIYPPLFINEKNIDL
jgi:hypothetical protein